MTSSELKLKAKEQLNGKKMNAAGMLLISFVIEWIFKAIITAIFPGDVSYINGIKITTDSPIASFLIGFLAIFLTLGITSYYMKIARGEEVTYSELFSKGNIFLKAFCSSILAGLAIFGGLLLLIIPGIILAFGYGLINYIYIDNPEIGIVEVMKKSRKMMKGHKTEYFCLMISFIGWVILVPFTLGILSFWLIPYMGVTQVNFYEAIKEENEGSKQEDEVIKSV